MLKAQEGQTAYQITRVYDDETGVLRMQQIRLDGLLHSPPDGEASHIAWDELGRPIYMAWHKTNLRHRHDGPQSIYINPENGIHTDEIFRTNDIPRTKDIGPYVVRRNEDTGEITEVVNEPNLQNLSIKTKFSIEP